MLVKTLEYYLAQDYPVEVRAIPEELGGGYSASIPYLGRWAFFAEGDTIQEALESLANTKRILFEDMIAYGKPIPDAPPLPEQESEVYSGKLLVRLPQSLHRDLAHRAEEERCSINQLVVTALGQYIGGMQLWATLASNANVCRSSTVDTKDSLYRFEPPVAEIRSIPHAALSRSESGYKAAA